MAHELTPKLPLLGHVAWFGWERFNELRIKFADGSPDQVRPENYDNSWAVSLGAEYQLTETWTLRSGFQYDETPTVDGFRDTGVPDGDRYWVAFGATYKLSDRFEFDLSYAHLFVGDGEIDLTRTFFASTGLDTTVNVKGTSNNSADFIAVQVRMRF